MTETGAHRPQGGLDEETRQMVVDTIRQLRKVLKTKASFPTAEAARKLLYLAHRNIVKKWNRPLLDWPKILNQLAIRFAERIPG